MLIWSDDCQLAFSGQAMVAAPAPGPEWLRRIVGEEYFTRVVALNLS